MFAFLLPPLCFVFLVGAFSFRGARREEQPALRAGFIAASVLWGLLVTAFTETLSALNRVESGWVAGLWVLATCLAAIALLRSGGGAPSLARLRVPRIPALEVVLVGGTAAILAAVALIAILAPPNSWDALGYRLSRVLHWMQNHNVDHYPTYVLPSLHQPPWAEYAVLHFQLLAGSDQWANLPQWFSLAGCLIAVSLIARELGFGARAQILSAVVACTVPVAILQASTAMGDVVTAFWTACLVYLALALRHSSRIWLFLQAGAALGLAVLTKGTAYVFAAPFVAMLGVGWVRERSARRTAGLILFGLTALALNLPHFWRNYETYGNPLGPLEEGGEYRYANDLFSLQSLASNLVRNAALDLVTPFGAVNRGVEWGVDVAHRLIGIDVDDERTTLKDYSVHSTILAKEQNWNEDWNAASPVQLLLILGCLVAFFGRRELRASRYLQGYCLALGIALTLFSFIFRWHQSSSRLLLPLLLLWSPFIGGVLFSTLGPRRAGLAGLALLLLAVPWVLDNRARPLVGPHTIFNSPRVEQYYNTVGLGEVHTTVARFALEEGCSNIGLFWWGHEFLEYAFWMKLHQTMKGMPIRLEHVHVHNASKLYAAAEPFRDFEPCVVISIGPGHEESLLYSGPNGGQTLIPTSGLPMVVSYHRVIPGRTPTETGSLSVFTDPPVQTTISVDGTPRNDWALDRLELPPGDHTVAFAEVGTFFKPEIVSVRRCNPACSDAVDQPAGRTVSVVPGETTEVRAVFAPVSTLRVTTGGYGAGAPTIFVNGQPANAMSIGATLPAGEYRISFEGLPEFPRPCSAIVRLGVGGSAWIHGDYATGSCEVLQGEAVEASSGEGAPALQTPDRLPSSGFLRVYGDPPVPTTIMLDGLPRNDFGLDYLALPAREYALSLRKVDWHETPAMIRVWECGATCSEPRDQPLAVPISVRPQETTYVEFTFAAVGYLRASAQSYHGPGSPTIFVDGQPAGESGVWVTLPRGEHTVSFEALPGWPQPCERIVSVEPGTTVSVEGNYFSGGCMPGSALS